MRTISYICAFSSSSSLYFFSAFLCNHLLDISVKASAIHYLLRSSSGII